LHGGGSGNGSKEVKKNVHGEEEKTKRLGGIKRFVRPRGNVMEKIEETGKRQGTKRKIL